MGHYKTNRQHNIIKKFFNVSFLLLFLSFIICANSCSKKSVFQEMNEYIDEHGKLGAFVSLNGHCYMFKSGVLDDTDNIIINKITGVSSGTSFSCKISPQYLTEGISIYYCKYENKENVLLQAVEFSCWGTVYLEDYNANKTIAYEQEDIPYFYHNLVLSEFEQILSSLSQGVLEPCGLSLKDFGVL